MEKKTPPKKRTEAELKAETARLAEHIRRNMAKPSRPVTKEDKLREMMEQNPKKAAELIRQIFLNK